MVFAYPPKVGVRDLGSQNGTFVNGQQIPASGEENSSGWTSEAYPLKNGDRVHVGQSAFRIQLDTSTIAAKICRCSECGLVVDSSDATAQADEIVCPMCRASKGIRNVEQSSTELVSGLELDQFGIDIPGYVPRHRLGEGGLGIVYAATEQRTGHEVAVKLIRKNLCTDKKAQALFLREMDILRRLEHPNIIQLLHCGFTEDLIFYVMELCKAGDLAEAVKERHKQMPVALACDLLLQFLSGLEYAHGRGVVHRDLKPSNLLIHSSENGKPILKIGDFGLAKQFQLAGFSGLTSSGQVGGSLQFLAREQLINYKETQPTSDVWSAAATFFYMLTGRGPRNEEAGDPVANILEGKLASLNELRPDVPRAVRAVIEHALLNEPGERFPTAKEFRAAFLAAYKGL
jgi:serine/threonine protein kinase